MLPIPCFEHDFIEYPWSDRQIAGLERLNSIYEKEVLKISIRNGKIAVKATQYVGMFRVGDLTIQVLPKMYRAGDGNPRETATRNFFYLLEYMDLGGVKFDNTGELLAGKLDWFEILTRVFATELQKQWNRGAYRTYQSIEELSPVLKGKWRLSEQFRRPARKHLFYIEHDEFTADNPLNRVFRFTIERLWNRTTDPRNRRVLSELRQDTGEVTLLPSVTLAMVDFIPITRLNQSFEMLRNLARVFLANESLQLETGGVETFAFCFDMNRVFENFVTEFIIQNRYEVLPDSLQDCELIPQAVKHAHCLARNQHGNSVFKLKPDLVFHRRQEYPIVLDVKYKTLDSEERDLNVSSNDFYQMFAYVHRYHCPLAIVVYPRPIEVGKSIEECFRIVGTDKRVKVGSIDLGIDLQDPSSRKDLIQQFKTLFQE